jgi:hypothetical protein
MFKIDVNPRRVKVIAQVAEDKLAVMLGERVCIYSLIDGI